MQPASAVEELATMLMAPARSGIYMTKNELLVLARLSDASLRISERKRMLVDIFRSAPDSAALDALCERLQAFCRVQLDEYERMAREFPASAPLFAPWIEKIRRTVAKLAEVREDVQL